MDTQTAQIQKKLQVELDSFKATQKEYSKMVQQRQLLDGQLNENKSVLEELNKLTEDKNTVYKLIGPILVKQSLQDSQQNISKRIDFIGKELQKCNDRLNGMEKEQDKHRENLGKLQQQLNVLQAMKA
ncbi:CLUMA_CG020439, isoform A [Clunio marinus]|uniref:Probable prefoldin subunit 6 n=1 Tax=Clunio marinus TaxID=568069 RepID=A0A1J1J501_9DIPT|nr:CLUMA_CG020439, isoform A [Clunio marinus]